MGNYPNKLPSNPPTKSPPQTATATRVFPQQSRSDLSPPHELLVELADDHAAPVPDSSQRDALDPLGYYCKDLEAGLLAPQASAALQPPAQDGLQPPEATCPCLASELGQSRLLLRAARGCVRLRRVVPSLLLRVQSQLSAYVLVSCLAFSLWFSSLQGCEEDIIVCANKLAAAAAGLVAKVALFSLANFALLVFARSQEDPAARRLGFAVVASNYCYIYCTGDSFSQEDHSQLNMALAFVFLFLYLLLAAATACLARLWRRSRSRFFATLAVVAGLGFLFYLLRVAPSCSRFNESLHPAFSYSEAGSECRWKKSGICWHFVIAGVFKPLFWGRTSCEHVPTDLSVHRAAAGHSRIVSFKLSTQVDYEKRLIFRDMQKDLQASMQSASPEELESGDRESFIDFRSSDQGEFVVKLRDLRGKGLARKLLPADGSHMNILHFFIDTVSRQRVYRAMPKTVELLKQHHFTQKQRVRVFEFFRHHAMAGYTWPNLMSSMYGAPDDSAAEPTDGKMVHMKRVESFAKEQGYVTGFASNFCNANEKEHDGRQGFTLRRQYVDPSAPDHEFLQPACDYNSFPMNNGFGFFFGRGPFSAARKCFMRKDLSQYSYRYMLDFFETYKRERKFFTLRMIDPHEFTEEVSSIVDEQIADVLREMIDRGHLDNTLVYFYSDHGDHSNYAIKPTESFEAERFNPFLYLLVPAHTQPALQANLLQNSQRLVSHRDIFATDLALLGQAQHPQVTGLSLLHRVVPADRTCDSLLVFDRHRDCKCSPENHA